MAGLEPATPALSAQCSNHLSYTPLRINTKKHNPNRFSIYILLRKEVIHPHLPVRIPCYDFTPITIHTLGTFLLTVEPVTSGANNSRGVTGGVYKTRERIHRNIADVRLLAIPTSWSRVADFNPNLDWLFSFAPRHRFAPLCTNHCSTCVAQIIRGMMTWRHPHLPPALRRQSS